MATETKDRRELIAEDLNGFLDSFNLPTVLRVEAKDLTLTDGGNGVRVSKKIGDVSIAIEVGQQSLMHLAMIRGFVGAGKQFLGSR